MYKDDFLKVASVTPALCLGDPEANVDAMRKALEDIRASVALFPELSISGYTANDLFFQHELRISCENAIERFLNENTFEGIVIFGAPLEIDGVLYNAAFVVQKDTILGIVPKWYLPNTQEFYEKRWFQSGADIARRREHIRFGGRNVPFGRLVFESANRHFRFGVEICEDMWAPISPGNYLALEGAQVIFNLSASNEYYGKREVRTRTIVEHSRRNAGAYVYASAGPGESTSETVFSGHNAIAQNGELLAESENFPRETSILYGDIDLSRIAHVRKRHSSYRDSINAFETAAQPVPFTLEGTDAFSFERPLDATPFVPKQDEEAAFERISTLLEHALLRRIEHTDAKRIVIGVSGGLDSALALMIAAGTMDRMGRPREDILAVRLPALASGERTIRQARELSDALFVSSEEIDLSEHIETQLSLIGHDAGEDVTYENAQARARTMTLFNLANRHEGIVLGTSDMSELALGWTTYGADHMSMYNINAGLPKTLVRFLVEQYGARFEGAGGVAGRIVETPISPELIKDQKSEDTLGRYEVNDFILHRFLVAGDGEARIEWLLREVFDLGESEASRYVSRFMKRFYTQQFKRQTSPDAPKVLGISLSPRSDFRMAGDVNKR